MILGACIALTVVCLVAAVLLWLRDREGGAVRAAGVAAVPMGLWASGLITLVLDAATALARWAGRISVNTGVTVGLSLLGLAIVLWVVGGYVGRRAATKRAVEGATGGDPKVVSSKTFAPTARSPKNGRKGGRAPADPEMDEIEQLLKSRGIG